MYKIPSSATYTHALSPKIHTHAKCPVTQNKFLLLTSAVHAIVTVLVVDVGLKNPPL